tara:strand:- start:1078 stop:1410 length:333 start_codon:yes stop_codon:yes gene_type:complete
MDEKKLLESIMKDIDPHRSGNTHEEILKRKVYLIDSPLKPLIETLIVSGNSFSDSVIKAYEIHTQDLEEMLVNFSKGYVLIDGSPRRVNSDEYDKCELTREDRINKMKGE